MDRKSLPFTLSEIKATDGGGWEVAGYASTFGGDPDSYGDIVVRGAFDESIAKRKTRLLWQHDLGEPIGKQLSLAEDDKGLFGRWSILPTDTGTKAHTLLHHDLIDSLSIGFIPVETEYREDGVRLLKKADLYEVSLVTIPANSNAVITSFKSDIPLSQQVLNATGLLEAVMREAKALHERRAADGREVNEKQREAEAKLDAVAKAWLDWRAALVVPPGAEATDQADHVALQLELLRRRYAPILQGASK